MMQTNPGQPGLAGTSIATLAESTNPQGLWPMPLIGIGMLLVGLGLLVSARIAGRRDMAFLAAIIREAFADPGGPGPAGA